MSAVTYGLVGSRSLRGRKMEPFSTGMATSAQSAGQEADLVCWGHIVQATLLGPEINVLRSHRTGHREVLEDGGEEKEQFVAGNAFAKTNALSCGHRE